MIRAQLERLVPDLSDGEWSLVVVYGHDLEVESGAIDLGFLAERVRQWRRDVGPAKPERVEFAEADKLARRASTRAEAVSALLAVEAAQDEDVTAFRREELRGRLIQPDRVGAWIDGRAEPPTQDFATVAVDRPDEPLEIFTHVLDYAAPPAVFVQHVGIALGSALDRLRLLSVALAE